MEKKLVLSVISLISVFLIIFLLSFKSKFKQITDKEINVSKHTRIEELFSHFENRFTYVKGSKDLHGVDMVYVITMPQRKEYITNEVSKLGAPFCYFDAVKPSDLSEDDYNMLSLVNDPKSRIYKKITRLPVLLSFIMCYMHAVKKGYNSIVVFEDDMIINVELDLLNKSLKEFDESNLDIFYMGYCFLNCKQLVEKGKYEHLVELSERNLLCCHSMCIKTHFLPELIDFCFPMKTNSDELFRNFYMMYKINVCVPRNVYFVQNRDSLNSLNQSLEDPEFFKTCTF